MDEMEKISKMSLKNGGGFVARIGFSYMDKKGQKFLSKHTGDILLGQTKTITPEELGVPDGSVVWMNVFVVWGKDNEAHQGFIFDKKDGKTAAYTITGTTLSNSLGLISVN